LNIGSIANPETVPFAKADFSQERPRVNGFLEGKKCFATARTTTRNSHDHLMMREFLTSAPAAASKVCEIFHDF
jgi:hypothetical protein